ncbi:MAG: hypothetical protein V2B18_23380 [Pseudomonadota bacterium]
MGVLLAAVMIVVFGMTTFSAAEFYVVKSRSGILRVVDHKPKGNATVVKGPFKTLDDAQKALKDVKEP